MTGTNKTLGFKDPYIETFSLKPTISEGYLTFLEINEAHIYGGIESLKITINSPSRGDHDLSQYSSALNELFFNQANLKITIPELGMENYSIFHNEAFDNGFGIIIDANAQVIQFHVDLSTIVNDYIYNENFEGVFGKLSKLTVNLKIAWRLSSYTAMCFEHLFQNCTTSNFYNPTININRTSIPKLEGIQIKVNSLVSNWIIDNLINPVIISLQWDTNNITYESIKLYNNNGENYATYRLLDSITLKVDDSQYQTLLASNKGRVLNIGYKYVVGQKLVIGKNTSVAPDYEEMGYKTITAPSSAYTFNNLSTVDTQYSDTFEDPVWPGYTGYKYPIRGVLEMGYRPNYQSIIFNGDTLFFDPSNNSYPFKIITMEAFEI